MPHVPNEGVVDNLEHNAVWNQYLHVIQNTVGVFYIVKNKFLLNSETQRVIPNL